MNIHSFNILVGVFSYPNMPVYSAAKSGIVGFTMSLRERSSSDGVRVNCICPHSTDTMMVKDTIFESNEIPEKIKADVRRDLMRYLLLYDSKMINTEFHYTIVVVTVVNLIHKSFSV